jgi:hypothetical protein
MNMKKIIYIIIGLLFVSGFPACTDWLDVNDNPSSASSTVPTPDLRLRVIQLNFTDTYESSGTRASWITQNITRTNGNSNNDLIQRWNCPIASTTWPYQGWFVYTAANLEPLIEKATAEEAWHYVGAAQLIHAWGFMTMLDLYGEMPYTEALGPGISPKYDDGKTIFYGCMDKLEEAIANFSKAQPASATPLSAGDSWNGGDVQKWIKLAYGLKARWLNNLTKKSFYDPNAVLTALEKAPQSVADNTTVRFVNTAETDKAGVVASLQFTNVGSTASRLSKWYTDLLTNEFTGGSGILDPRATRIIPSGEFNTADGKKEWRLSKGADIINTNIRTQNNGPAQFEIRGTKPGTTNAALGLEWVNTAAKKKDPEYKNRWYSTNTNAVRMGDSVYISVYSDRLDWIVGTDFPDQTDDRYIASRYNGISTDNPNYGDANSINVTSTGSFYIRADAPGHLVCYHEMCFIKAEALFRLGKKDEAVSAYKAGIRAHIEAMNEKLKEYPQILGKQVISESEIAAFLSSAAVAQNGAELTMAKIMQQKQISMSMTLQNWTDMRRFNFSVPDPQYGVVYPDFGRPFEFDAAAQECYPTTNPNELRYWPRRIQQCSHEVNYNSANWLASNPEANARTILSYPVWWDVPGNE